LICPWVTSRVALLNRRFPRRAERAVMQHARGSPHPTQREFFIDNLLVRIHFIIVTIRWTGLAPSEFESVGSAALPHRFCRYSTRGSLAGLSVLWCSTHVAHRIPHSGTTSCLSSLLMCTTGRRIPASSSANQGRKKTI